MKYIPFILIAGWIILALLTMETGNAVMFIDSEGNSCSCLYEQELVPCKDQSEIDYVYIEQNHC